MGCIPTKLSYPPLATTFCRRRHEKSSKCLDPFAPIRHLTCQEHEWKVRVESRTFVPNATTTTSNSSGQSSSHPDLFSIFGPDFSTSLPPLSTLPDPDWLSKVTANPAQTFVSLQVKVGVSSNRGRRLVNEDTYTIAHTRVSDQDVGFFAVYDGHNGSYVSKYCQHDLHSFAFLHLQSHPMDVSLVRACRDLEEQVWSKQISGGSTAILMMLRGCDEVVFASLGDSQAILSRNGIAYNVCQVHTPTLPSEKARIVNANGRIRNGRIFGLLGVSRAFGDLDFKTSRGPFRQQFQGDLVSAKPDVVTYRRTRGDEFVLLASDGLFDVMTPQQAVLYVRLRLKSRRNVQIVTQELVAHALTLGVQDNVCVLLLCFGSDIGG